MHHFLRLATVILGLAGLASSANADMVTILRSTRAANIGLTNGADNDLNSFYVSEGFTSSLFTGAVTDTTLAGASLFVAMLPDDNFAASEITAMNNFLSTGGRIMFMGEQNGFAPAENARINLALFQLGSGLSLGTLSLDTAGLQNTNPAQISDHPLNNGIDLINYGSVNAIVGTSGSVLFTAKQVAGAAWGRVESLNGGEIVLLADTNMISNIEFPSANDNHVFFANVATAVAVPEPSSLIMFGFAASSFLLSKRTRRKSNQPTKI